MLELSIGNNLIFLFNYTGSWWQSILLFLWVGKKCFYYEPYPYSSLLKKKIDKLYFNKTKLNLVWFDSVFCDKYYERASINVFSNLTSHPNEKVDFFLKYHFHREINKSIHLEFQNLLLKESELNKSFFNAIKASLGRTTKLIRDNFLTNFLSLFVHFLLILLFLLKDLCLKRNIIKKNVKIKKKIMVDFNFGINFSNFSLNLPHHYDDGFLFRFDKKFKFNDLVLYNRFWNITDISEKELAYNKKGIHIVGTLNRRSDLNMSCIRNSLKFIINYFLLLNRYFNCLSSSKFHYSYLLFLYKSMIFFWDLDSVNVKTYLSRIDYNPDHHALGLVCKAFGIHFAGIAHSPGLGYIGTPNQGILSFDSFFCHSGVIKEKFFPSWKKSRTNIYSIGVWRSDIIYKLKLSNESQILRKKILLKYNCQRIILLHPPPAGSYVLDPQYYQDWFDTLFQIIKTNQTDFFIISERRSIKNLLPIYEEWLKKIILLPNIVLSSTIFEKSLQSYNIVSFCDIVLCPNYSDQFFECVANNIKCVTYSNSLFNVDYIKNFFSLFNVSNGTSLIEIYKMIKQNKRYVNQEFNKMRKNIRNADCKSISRMVNILQKVT